MPKRPNTPYKTKHYKGWDGQQSAFSLRRMTATHEHRLELAARSRPAILLCGASFGHALERALVRGKLVGCGAIQLTVRLLCDAP